MKEILNCLVKVSVDLKTIPRKKVIKTSEHEKQYQGQFSTEMIQIEM